MEMGPLRTAGLEPRLVAGLQLLSVEQVRRLLLTAEREGWIILGLEGFEIVGGGVKADFDQIADWSSLRKTHVDQLSARSVEATLRFLDTEARGDRLYEVVVSERE